MLPLGLCEEKFVSNEAFMEHLERHESQLFQEKEIKYEPDSDQYSDAGSLILDCVKEEEQLQGHKDETQSGDSEKFSLASSEEYHKLHKKQSSSETFMCPKCSYKTINKNKFKEHMNVMHLNKIKCEHCPKRYPTQGRLANHVREKHKNEDIPKLPEDEFFCITAKQQGNGKTWYECLKCTYKTEKRSDVYRHIRGFHRELLVELYKSKGMVTDDAGYHKCTKCFYKTLDKFKLKEHIKIVHQKRRDFICDLCNKAFSRKEDLMQHMKRIHILAESSKLYKCSICAYKTIHKRHLKDHLNSVHYKIREFTCDLCRMQFSTKQHVQRHIERVHLKICLKRRKILSCNRGRNCSFSTTEHREFLGHIRRVHEKVQGFSCEICDKWYSLRRSLFIHMKTQHLSIGRLTCELCQKILKNRACLYEHMRRMHLKRKG